MLANLDALFVYRSRPSIDRYHGCQSFKEGDALQQEEGYLAEGVFIFVALD